MVEETKKEAIKLPFLLPHKSKLLIKFRLNPNKRSLQINLH
jgi:hypothetical protein